VNRRVVLFLSLVSCATKDARPADTAADTAADTGGDTSAVDSHTGDSIPVDTSHVDTDPEETAETADTGEPPPPPTSLFPVAPDASHRMWQGVQEAFVTGDGVSCAGAVTVGVGQSAVCYAAADGALRCAGALYGRSTTTSFDDVGLRDVQQVFLSADGSAGTSVCALAGGRVSCLGDHNDYGQFGSGSTGDLGSFVAGSASSLTHLATGAWDQLCAPSDDGSVQCAGYSYGASFTSAGSGSWVWVGTDGRAHLEDSTVWRASADHTIARLGTRGLDCDSVTCRYGALDGQTGLVDVVVKQRLPDGVKSSYPEEVCTLSTSGTVTCTHLNPTDGLPLTDVRFAGKHVLLLAASYAASSLCAVVDDGSLWCLGANEHGQLGTGDAAYQSTERMVVPAGGVRVDCH